MSLNYNLGQIKDYKKVCLDEKGEMKGVSKEIIFCTMFVDIGRITEKNYHQFHSRMRLFDAAVGASFSGITLEDVKAHIGLSVNVNTLTWKQFLKKLKSVLERVMEREEKLFFHKLEVRNG